MKTVEFSPITRTAIAQLLASRGPQKEFSGATGNRQTSRWPFPGTVQIWKTGKNGQEDLVFASSLNMGLQGIGVRMDEPLDVGCEVSIAIHEPEISFQGRAVVRHNSERDGGWYLGLQFVFDQEHKKKGQQPKGN
ncbi:MAG: PilZ domain-containing protein [Planctomycetota bacterium]|jgi:hypothetical protein